MVARSDVIFSCACLVYLGMTQAGNDLVRGCSLNAACKLATFSPSRQGLRSFGFDDSFTVLKLHSCAFEGSFSWEGETQGVYLHETLQLPWLGDKRPDYSTWHPLVWRCLNIVQSKCDPGLFSFLLSTSPSLPLVSVLAPVFPSAERRLCVPAPRRSLKMEVLKVNVPLWLTSCESSTH